MDVMRVGPLPTPAISMLTRSFRADLGVMISASHNPFSDNGIKLFGPNGAKLSDELERMIEEQLDSLSVSQTLYLGQMTRMEDAVGRYIEFVKSSLPRHLSLEGMRVVVDCAHGAAYRVAPLVLQELGATVIPINVTPDGYNINKDCGTMHPEIMCAKVKETQAHVGIALDGDADRVIFSDEKGQVIDGDQLIAFLAKTWDEKNLLNKKAVVGTVMSNLGLEQYLENQGLTLMRAQVGDRYITEKMREENCILGGEPSGHIILSEHATGGDGLLTALQILAVLSQKQKPASEILNLFKPCPQVTKNVALPAACLERQPIKSFLQEAQARLGKRERLLIRPSGTEPLIRVMVEGEDEARVQELSDQISQTLISLAEQEVA